MKNWKTTIFGLLAGSGQVVSLINPKYQFIANILSALGVGLLGIYAKDHNVTGGDIIQ